jgi:hypothetical protein
VSGEVTPEQERAALEWQAEEAAAARGVQAKVDALNEPTAAPQTPEAQAQAAQAAQVAAVLESQIPKLCSVAWAIVDRLVQQMAGAEFALSPDERKDLAAATVPVVQKYVPQGMDWLTTTPEGALALTAGMIYGMKFLAPPAPPATPAPVAAPEATA